jgi:hypothetical protein
LENRYDTLLSNVTRLHREITNLNKRASVRPAPAGAVAEGEQQVTSTMVAYGQKQPGRVQCGRVELHPRGICHVGKRS